MRILIAITTSVGDDVRLYLGAPRSVGGRWRSIRVYTCVNISTTTGGVSMVAEVELPLSFPVPATTASGGGPKKR